MVDQVYRIGEVRDQIVALLRTKPEGLTAGALCVALGLPLWAVQAGLDAAAFVDMVTFAGGRYQSAPAYEDWLTPGGLLDDGAVL